MAKDCRRLFEQAQYAPAARCFQGLLPKLDQDKNLEGVRPLLKDRYLRNAAIAWNRAAEQQQDIAAKGYHKEQAVLALQESIQQGYCKAAERCTFNQDLIRLLREQIGYGSLVVVTGQAQSNILVVGLHVRQEGAEPFKYDLRPGSYTVTITLPQRAPQIRKIEIKPKHRLVLNVTPTQILLQEREIIVAQKVPPLVIAGYVVGGVALAAGVILSIAGVAIQANLNAVRSDPVAQAQQAEDAYHREFDSAGSVVVAGGVAMGAGALILAGGVVGHLTSRASTQPYRTPLLRKSLDINASLPGSSNLLFSFSQSFR